MRLIFKVAAIIFIYLMNVTFFPQVYFGLILAIAINLFFSQRLSYYFIIILGLCYDLFLYRVFGFSTTLVFLLLVKGIESLIALRKKNKKDFVDLLIAVILMFFILNLKLFYAFNRPEIIRELGLIFLYNLIAAGLIYFFWLRLEKVFESKKYLREEI